MDDSVNHTSARVLYWEPDKTLPRNIKEAGGKQSHTIQQMFVWVFPFPAQTVLDVVNWGDASRAAKHKNKQTAPTHSRNHTLATDTSLLLTSLSQKANNRGQTQIWISLPLLSSTQTLVIRD